MEKRKHQGGEFHSRGSDENNGGCRGKDSI